MKFRFNEKKAAQAAALLIKKSGGEMNYLALIKLLYLADRESLLKHGHPITGDRTVAMDHGMVLSRICDFVSQKKQERSATEWHRYIPRPKPMVYTCHVASDPGMDQLSKADIGILEAILERFKDKDEWDLVEISHALPEWKDPQGSSIPVEYEEILKLEGRDQAQIDAMASDADAVDFFDRAVARAGK